jgi:hypothetical protein
MPSIGSDIVDILFSVDAHLCFLACTVPYRNTEDIGSYFTVPHLLKWRLFKLECAVTVLWLRAEHGFLGGCGGFWTRATLFCLYFYTTLSRRENLILPLGVLQTQIFLPVHMVFPSNIL